MQLDQRTRPCRAMNLDMPGSMHRKSVRLLCSFIGHRLRVSEGNAAHYHSGLGKQVSQQYPNFNSNPRLLEQVFGRAAEKGIKIDVTERFKDRLVDEGYNPAYGARPLRRAIMRLLEDSMAERMLTGDIKARAAS